MRECIVVIDLGSQYTWLIARKIRELKVYCEVLPPDVPWERIKSLSPKGIILSGGPRSVYEDNAPMPPGEIFSSGYATGCM